MTDEEFMKSSQDRLERFQGEQKLLHKRLANDLSWTSPLRIGLSVLAGSLALGLGLSVGYQITRR